MTLALPGPRVLALRVTLPLTLLLAAVLALPGATPATAAPPSRITVNDGVQAGAGWDLRRVEVASAVRGGRDGVVRLVTARQPRAGQAYSVWFDLDRDARPDALLTAYPESEWVVNRARSWSRAGSSLQRSGCFDLDGARRGFRITVDPHCLARPRALRVAALGFRYDQGGDAVRRDWVPAPRTWSPRVRAFRAAG